MTALTVAIPGSAAAAGEKVVPGTPRQVQAVAELFGKPGDRLHAPIECFEVVASASHASYFTYRPSAQGRTDEATCGDPRYGSGIYRLTEGRPVKVGWVVWDWQGSKKRVCYRSTSVPKAVFSDLVCTRVLKL